ncbi:pre-toxin TG domain-containing protein [Bacillus licheniformis]|nr:pre-toxin TG domain-containing protein [Bacillus licheniformis]
MEFTGVYDAVRAAFGYDLATGEIVKGNGDRLMAGLSVTPLERHLNTESAASSYLKVKKRERNLRR